MSKPRKPSRLAILEYAAEGLRTMIGIGTGYEYEEVIEEYEDHLVWIENEMVRIMSKDTIKREQQ